MEDGSLWKYVAANGLHEVQMRENEKLQGLSRFRNPGFATKDQ
jgi:hypothetical protein